MKLNEAIEFMQQCKIVENGIIRQCEPNEVPSNVEVSWNKNNCWDCTTYRLANILLDSDKYDYRINNDLLPKQKQYVPYASGDLELILSRGNVVRLKGDEILRWFTSLFVNNCRENVYVAGCWHSFGEMLTKYIYPDGAPFGKEI